MERAVKFKWGGRVYNEVIEGNIELGEMAPDDLADALNRAVGNFAFYGSLRADAKKMLNQIETDADMWMAMQTNKVGNNPDYKKLTSDKAKGQQVMLDNSKEWSDWEAKKRAIQLVVDKSYVLVTTFELMTKTLQSVLAFRRQELGNIYQSASPNAQGSGDLMDVDSGSSVNARVHKG